ncbi:MAG: GNAT family N-acetyltransferase [Firmicutes bacterium]|nr:GNAT family N-acetyltransferase [Bacillota bacterium]
MTIRLIKKDEISQVQKLAIATCASAWKDYYPQRSIDYVIKNDLTLEKLDSKISESSFYVVLNDKEIIGCGGIKPMNKTESAIFAIFVSPLHQGKGLGKVIMETLENDKFGKRANRIELPSSLPGIPFYKKLGYEHKNGKLNYGDGQFIMEKRFKL